MGRDISYISDIGNPAKLIPSEIDLPKHRDMVSVKESSTAILQHSRRTACPLYLI